MAFTTSDTFQYAGVWLYESHPGQLQASRKNTNGDFSVILFGRGRTPNA